MEKVIGASFRVRFKELLTGISDTSPGGYCVRTRAGEEIAFDFTLSHVEAEGRAAEYEVKAPDLVSFPGMVCLPEKLGDVVEFPECHVWCEEPGQKPEGIEAFCLELAGTGDLTPEILERYKNTEYITSEIVCGKEDYLFCCHFTRKLLDTCKSSS